jgi:succinyl-CoA synthetase alpha subunit
MTLDQYNDAVKAILAEQQQIAQDTGKLCMAGQANLMNPEFVKVLSRQGALIQQIAKLNTEAMMGIMTGAAAGGR